MGWDMNRLLKQVLIGISAFSVLAIFYLVYGGFMDLLGLFIGYILVSSLLLWAFILIYRYFVKR